MRRLISSMPSVGLAPGLLAIALLLGACAGVGDEPTAAPLPTASSYQPAATLIQPSATVGIGEDLPTETATSAAAATPTATLGTATEDATVAPQQATPLQTELDLPAGTAVALHQTGGFAGVDNLWIFFGDGVIDTAAGEQGSVEPEDVAAQSAALAAAGFFEMAQPNSKPVCCDHFNYTLYARDGGRENVITVSGGDPDLSPELLEVILALQTLATAADGA